MTDLTQGSFHGKPKYQRDLITVTEGLCWIIEHAQRWHTIDMASTRNISRTMMMCPIGCARCIPDPSGNA